MIRAVILLVSLGATAVHGEDLGVRGQTVQIDVDARSQIKADIRKKERSGELDRYWKDYRSKVINAIKYPAPLGVPTDFRVRTERHTLRFVMPQDYRDEQRRVVVPRGTVIEPLKMQPLTSGLLFIDGRDEAQVQFAMAAIARERLKIVLTAGSPYDLRVRFAKQRWNGTPVVPFYFDQRKHIIQQLERLYGINLRSVPAKLTQQGSQLQIDFGIQK